MRLIVVSLKKSANAETSTLAPLEETSLRRPEFEKIAKKTARTVHFNILCHYTSVQTRDTAFTHHFGQPSYFKGNGNGLNFIEKTK